MLLKISCSKLPLIQRFAKDRSGVITLEMTLALIPFILMFLFIAELCSVLYISVSIDLAMAEAMRYTTASPNPSVGTYKKLFSDKMEERIKTLPLLIYDTNKIIFDTWYCTKLMEIANNTCNQSAPSANTPVAFYTIQYHYDPIFLPVPDMILNHGMNRKGIYVMENHRIRQQSEEPVTP